MLKKLKHILNTYTDKELEDMDLWINSSQVVEMILIEEDSINLVTDNSEVKIDGYIEKERKNND